MMLRLSPDPSGSPQPRRAQPKRVLVLNHYALPLDQGGGTRHIELFSQLDGRVWDFTIIAANRLGQSPDPFTTEDPHFALVHIPRYNGNGRQRIAGWLLFALRAVGAGIRGRRPAVVYASTPHLLTPIAGWLLARLRRARFVLEVRDLWPESLVEFGFTRRGSFVHRALSLLETFLYKRADAIVTVTPGWTDYLQSQGVERGRISTVSNGSDPEMFQPAGDANALRKRLGNVEGALVVYAGAHGPPNGLDAALDAAREMPCTHFVLIGSGVDKSTLVTRAANEGLANVHFLDPMPKAELATLLWTADIGLHTLADMDLFRSGMSPNKLYDYMAAGLPVVSNAGGAAHDVIREAGCGEPASPDGIATAVRRILERPASERARMGRQGREWVAVHASRATTGASLQSVLDDVVTTGSN